jgi:hypothetical protein
MAISSNKATHHRLVVAVEASAACIDFFPVFRKLFLPALTRQTQQQAVTYEVCACVDCINAVPEAHEHAEAPYEPTF